MERRVVLPGLPDTLALGRAMAESLPEGWKEPIALLRAGLGSGKTTLTRGFVQALPGGDSAEVASPSFNLANVYPTDPPVAHLDLYRLGEGFMDPGLEELLYPGYDPGPRVILVEWAEYLPGRLFPDDYLDISIRAHGEGREALLAPKGPQAVRWLDNTLSTLSKSGMS